MSTSDAAIVAEGLTKRFGGRPVVDGVSLRVERGSTLALIGLNGAGKSTLLRMLAGLLAPDAGAAFIRGVDIWADPIRAKRLFGYVPDRPTVYPWMRVRDALAFARSVRSEFIPSRADSLLKQFRLPADQRVGKLSKGMAGKLSLLLALAHDPAVLILDEPTDGMDPLTREEFMEGLLDSMAEEPRGVIISSHALHEVQRLSDSVAILHAGKILERGTTEELVRTTRRVRLAMDAETLPTLPPGVVLARQRGRELVLTVRGEAGGFQAPPGGRVLEITNLTLDEVFKDLVRAAEGGAEVSS